MGVRVVLLGAREFFSSGYLGVFPGSLGVFPGRKGVFPWW